MTKNFGRDMALEKDARAIIKRQTGRGRARLLKDSDLNIGNKQQCDPQPAITSFPETNPPRILNLEAMSETGQMMTVIIGASNLNAMIAGFAPNITSIIEFGNGGVFTRAEVDVPVGEFRFTGTQPFQPVFGGTVVTVPAATLRVYGRNDSNLLTPDIRGFDYISPASTPGGIVDHANKSLGAVSSVVPVIVQAFAGYYTHRGVHAPKRTLWIADNPAIAIVLTGASTSSGIGQYAIPPFASRFRVIRLDAFGVPAPAVTASIFTSGLNRIGDVIVAAGVDFPMTDLPGNSNRIGLNITVPIGGTLGIEFEIEL